MKNIALAAVALSSTMLVAACGTDDSTDETTTVTEQAPASSSAQATETTQVQPSTSANDTAASPKISQQEAEEIALKDAGVTRDQLTDNDTADLDTDDDRNNRPVWEFDFEVGNMDYTYDIDAETGEILQRESDR